MLVLGSVEIQGTRWLKKHSLDFIFLVKTSNLLNHVFHTVPNLNPGNMFIQNLDVEVVQTLRQMFFKTHLAVCGIMNPHGPNWIQHKFGFAFRQFKKIWVTTMYVKSGECFSRRQVL